MAETVIQTTGLTKTFGDGFQAVKGLDLEIKEGEVFGLLGPNGAGKTTTIRMITGLSRPTSGQTEIAGEKVDPGSVVIRKRVGVVPQHIVVWEKLTCWENLMLMARDMGYESGPMIGFDPDKVSEVVGLDEIHPPLMLVVVGKGAGEAWPRMGLLDLEEVASIDRLGNHPFQGAIDA